MQELVLHLLATLRYRFDHAISRIDDSYPEFYAGSGVRTPVQILHHMRGLMYYTKKILTEERTQMSSISDWREEVQLFYSSIESVKQFIESNDFTPEQYMRITQGPISDAISHVGQLAMLSRMCGTPVEKQNYSKAKI